MTASAALMVRMTTYDESLHPRGQAQNAGQFRAKENDAPTSALTPTAPETRCTECGESATYRYANVPRGYRGPHESAFCATHAAEAAVEGHAIEHAPKPLESGERAVWLIEGDDHEYELVEADAEDEAIDAAAALFDVRYGDEDDSDSEFDMRDSLTVVGVFRGDPDDTDELEFAPYGDISENDAYAKLDYA